MNLSSLSIKKDGLIWKSSISIFHNLNKNFRNIKEKKLCKFLSKQVTIYMVNLIFPIILKIIVMLGLFLVIIN